MKGESWELKTEASCASRKNFGGGLVRVGSLTESFRDDFKCVSVSMKTVSCRMGIKKIVMKVHDEEGW